MRVNICAEFCGDDACLKPSGNGYDTENCQQATDLADAARATEARP